MARLPDQGHVIQQSGGIVTLSEDFTERELVRFDPSDGRAVTTALDVIRDSELGDESKCFAWFWAGYFHAHADRAPEVVHEPFITETVEGQEVTVTSPRGLGLVVVQFDPRDADASAMAQKAIYDSGLDVNQKARAHFWSGFFYGQSSS
jgi:hypothetical protein